MKKHHKDVDVRIDWMQHSDLWQATDIESRSFEFPWFEDDFLDFMRLRGAIPKGVYYGANLVGYLMYERLPTYFHLVNFAVDPQWRRLGIGSRMMRYLTYALGVNRDRKKIATEVRETNLCCQQFLRASGFRAKAVMHDFYEGTDEPAYLFEYDYRPTIQEALMVSSTSAQGGHLHRWIGLQ